MNNNNYTPFVEFVKEKEQTEFFFQLGLYIRPSRRLKMIELLMAKEFVVGDGI